MYTYLEVMFLQYMERIQNLRKKAGVSQTYIAELLKVGQKTYSDYELGKSRIPLESMIILAKYYNVSMDYICGVSDIPNPFPRK